jgi:hypothetical protein
VLRSESWNEYFKLNKTFTTESKASRSMQSQLKVQKRAADRRGVTFDEYLSAPRFRKRALKKDRDSAKMKVAVPKSKTRVNKMQRLRSRLQVALPERYSRVVGGEGGEPMETEDTVKIGEKEEEVKGLSMMFKIKDEEMDEWL